MILYHIGNRFATGDQIAINYRAMSIFHKYCFVILKLEITLH